MTVDDRPSLEALGEQVRATVRAARQRGRAGRLIWLVVAVLAGGLLSWWLWREDEPVAWQFHTVDRGDLVLAATATGNLEPKSEVIVGAEISGLIEEVLVAENDEVETGAVLARFDVEELSVSLEQAEARLALATASVAEAEATLEEAAINERRMETVVERGSGSQADLDTARAVRKRASAQLAHAHASVREARASVSQARTRLDKAVITSPIDGVVLQRTVEPGSTVAASFQTPQLFLLAEDLREMELHVSLDEADVGLVKAGQSAVFMVDAWPDLEFQAQVLMVYLYPTIDNNVVTYTTVLAVDNSAGRLLPGMTATATIISERREQVLRVPSVALRFEPPRDDTDDLVLAPHGRIESRSKPGNGVWVLRDGVPERVPVRTGYTDGRYTELLGGELAAGDEILIGVLGR